jgi:hypothetical protein
MIKISQLEESDTSQSEDESIHDSQETCKDSQSTLIDSNIEVQEFETIETGNSVDTGNTGEETLEVIRNLEINDQQNEVTENILISGILKDYPQYTENTKLEDISPEHFGFLAFVGNSATFVPERYIKKIRKVYNKYMLKIVSEPAEENWKKFLLLSAIIYDTDFSQQLRIRKDNLVERLDKLLDDNWENFTIGSLSKKNRREKNDFTEKEIHNTALRMLKAGEIGKAFNKIKQDKRIIMPTREILEKIKEKHPEAEEDSITQEEKESIFGYNIMRDNDVIPIEIQCSQIETILAKSHNLVAHGLDKTRYEHLKILFATNDKEAENKADIMEFRTLFTEVIQRISRGDVPDNICPIFRDFESVALPKNDNDIRPIGLQLIYRKIAGKALQMAANQFNEEYFKGIQYCNAMAGTETIIHAMRMAVGKLDCFLIDGQNAFNNGIRLKGLLNIKRQFPAMLPYLRMIYGNPSNAWYYGLSSGVESFKSSEGAQQGCVNGMWFYAMIIHPFLQGLHDILGGEGFVKFYADDGNLATTYEKMIECIQFISNEGAKVGFHLNLDKGYYLMAKCESIEVAIERKRYLMSLGLNENIIKLHPDNNPLNELEYGAKILGSYIGSDSYIEKQLMIKIDSLRQEAISIKSFQDVQGQHLMLRYCFAQKINYLQRTTPPCLLKSFVKQFDKLKRDICNSIVGFEIEDIIWDQCCLKVQHGGLGYQNANTVSQVAYIASFMEASAILKQHFPHEFDDLDNTCFQSLRDAIEALNHICERNVDQKFTFQELQLKLMNLKKGDTFQNTLNELTVENDILKLRNKIENNKHLAWFDALFDDFAGEWLNVPPKNQKNSMESLTFRTALRYRLYLSTPAYIDGSKCMCKRKPKLDNRGQHLATGCGCCDSRKDSHDSMVDIWREMLGKSGIKSIKEEKYCFQTVDVNDKRRPDITVKNMPGTNREVLLDASITSPIQNGEHNISRNQALNRGRLANKRYQEKQRKYSEICERSGYEFIPIVFVSTGAFHKEAATFFDKLLDIMIDGNIKLKPIYRRFWAARFSCTLQKAIAYAILSKSKIINGSLLHSTSYQLRNSYIGNFPMLNE